MSGLLKSSGSGSVQEPWKEQQGYLKEGWAEAANLYHDAKSTPYYTGSTYAGPSQEQRELLGNMFEQGGAMIGNGENLSDVGRQFLANANSRENLAPVTAGSNVIDGQIRYQPVQTYTPGQAGTQQIYNKGAYQTAAAPTIDLTSQNYGTGGQYDLQNNKTFTDALAAAMNPVKKNFKESVLPAIRTNSITNGAYGGARQALAEGTAASNANQQMGDIAAKLFLDQYGKERDIGSRQEDLSTTLAADKAKTAATLGTDIWKTGESLGTSRYNTTEGITGSDIQNRNTLNSNWAINADNNALKNVLAGNENELQAILAGNKNQLDWNTNQTNIAAQQNLNRDNLNQAWDLSKLNQASGLVTGGQGLASQGYNTAGSAGSQGQAWDQQKMDADLNAWLNEQNWLPSQLKQYTGITQGYDPGLITTTKNNPLTSIFGGALGGATGGAALGNLTGLFSSQQGGGYGALLGALLGGF